MRLFAFLLVAASAQDLFLFKTPEEGKASVTDLSRAKRTTHSGHVAGSSTAEQTKKINAHLKKQGHNLKTCGEHTFDELNDKIRAMWPHMSKEMQQIYKGKDLRQLAHQTLEEFENRWQSELTSLGTRGDASALPALRDAKCAEVLMMWVHHVHDDGKKALQDMVLPLLEEFNMDHVTKQPKLVANRYASSYTCVTGHNMRANHTSDHKFPHWPEEVHYEGRGHGAYPFWAGGGGSGSSAAIDVYWSEKQMAERFYHASCSMTEVGYSKDTACYHLFVGGQPNPAAYLYTATKDFCCISGPTSSRGFRSPSHSNTSFPPPGGSEKLAPPQSDFMDDFTLAATEDFNGDFYKGTVKRYLMQLSSSEAVDWFWYVTTEDGKPVEQGEGGKSEKDGSGKGIQIWHEYNTDTFKSTTVDPSIFEVPSICKSTSKTCQFP